MLVVEILNCFFVLIRRRPPISTRTDTLFPYTTLFRARRRAGDRHHEARQPRLCVARNDRRIWCVTRDRVAARILRARRNGARLLCMGHRRRNLWPQGVDRSEERRVGTGWWSTVRSRGSPDN